MRSARTKLAIIAGLAVVLAMVAASIVFNLFIGWKVETDAVRDIEYALEWDLEDEGTGRVPNYIVLNSSYAIDPAERRWSAEEEVELAAWFSRHSDEGVVSRVVLGDWTCYAGMVAVESYDSAYGEDYYEVEEIYDPHGRHGWEAAEYESSAGYLVAYIDVTGEQMLVASVNSAFAIIAIVGAIVAAGAGFAAGRRIDRAQDAQKRFYENMSHDLKTPLAAIRGYAEGARSGVVALEDATGAIERECGKMTGMIEEILGLARLESGAVELRRETVCVSDFVQDCLMPFEGDVRAKGLEVELDLAPGSVEADPGLFDHALTNVLSNAVRHADRVVRVGYDGLAIRVANDGVMPSREQVGHLFDRYYAGEGGSSGIGLAIAREIAVLHGWEIGASVEGPYLVIALRFAS